jgi:N-acyl-D-aspartate/D-glutamate deacylase
MTALSARQFKLARPRRIAPGAFADVTLFDADTVIDVATFEHPIATAHGIRGVIVNGEVAYAAGAVAPTRAGRFLRSNAN